MTNPTPGEQKDYLLAHYYDLEYCDYTADLDFYVQYATALDAGDRLPLLELGCGTGRVAIALAEAGLPVVGVDTSAGMLEVAERKAARARLAERVTWLQADMRSLPRLPQAPFNLAICPLNTFAYLQSTAEQLAMLRSVHPLLVQHGILIVDLTPPHPHLLAPADGELILQGSFRDDEGAATVHKLVAGGADYSTQTQAVTIFYDREGDDGSFSRLSQELSLRWTGRYEMDLLLTAAGYRVERVYGRYELDDYGEASDRMIFVART